MNGTMHKWLLKSLGSLSLASTVVLLPLLLTGCGESSTSTVTPVPPPPPPPPPAPPAPPPPPPTPTPTPPVGRVIAIDPADGATNVSITTKIVISFSEPVRQAPFAQALSITSVAPQEGVVPDYKLEFNADRTQVTIIFDTPLTNDAVYRVVISRAVPDLFASGRSLPEDFVATFTTGFVAASERLISLLPTQLAAITRNGQIFSSPVVIPVGYGIRRGAGAAENLPVGVYDDYRAVLSFPIPASIPGNAVVQAAQLTLVQLPSKDSATIPGFGDKGLGFFFLDPTPHNLPANNVVFQEVTLGAPDNVVSSDFFAPASSPTFVALSINGNVLGDDVSAGPRTADVGPGVQRAVSGSRFYQVRLQCAKEVWNNQAAPDFVSVLATASASVGVDVSTAAIGALGSLILAGTLTVPADDAADATDVTAQVNAADLATAVLEVAGATTQAVFGTFTATVSVSNALPSGDTVSAIVTLTFGSFTQSAQLPSALVIQNINVGSLSNIAAGTFTVPKLTDGDLAIGDTFTVPFGALTAPPGFVALTDSVEATALVTASVSFNVTSPVSYEVSQGATGTCRAEFDREPATGTGAGPITTARGPRLDITFTIPR